MEITEKIETKIVIEKMLFYLKYIDKLYKQIPKEVFGEDVEFLPELYEKIYKDIGNLINKNYTNSDFLADEIFKYINEYIKFDEFWEKMIPILQKKN